MKIDTVIPFTSEVLANQYLNSGYDERTVLWAESMVMAGFISDHLNILLGEIPPFNKFELDHIIGKITVELGLPKITSKREAVDIKVTADIVRCLQGDDDRSLLVLNLAQLYNHDDETRSLEDFFLLDQAQMYLENDINQYTWPNADKSNIKHVILDYLFKWVDEHSLNNWHPFEWKVTDPDGFPARPTSDQLKPSE